MTLYEIDSAIQALVDPESGELMDYDAFAALQMEREVKLSLIHISEPTRRS